MANYHGIPFPDDMEGMVIAVGECATHGAHIDYLVVVGGTPAAGGQLTPDQADQLSEDFARAASAARETIRAAQN